MNICIECSKEFIPSRNSTGKFCSRSCAAKRNNRVYPKRKNLNKRQNCINCDKLLKYWQIKFCSKKCFGYFTRKNNVEKWTKGETSGSWGNGVLSGSIRASIVSEAGYKCSQCGWGKPNPITGKPILAVDHIDGNWMNNSPDNLRVLCYNCHTLTETFCSLNKNGLSKSRPGGFKIREGKFNNTAKLKTTDGSAHPE